MITITLHINRELKYAKEMYNLFFGNDRKQKVLKKDLETWFESLLEADIDDADSESEDDLFHN